MNLLQARLLLALAESQQAQTRAAHFHARALTGSSGRDGRTILRGDGTVCSPQDRIDADISTADNHIRHSEALLDHAKKLLAQMQTVKGEQSAAVVFPSIPDADEANS